ncbi:MAG: efflux RND transporter periplasmic adaptor subunit [Terracidiphilus sp.]|nr:efflux RND transporter periplasmic adaptor subunit [Terracidiphilus sp.]
MRNSAGKQIAAIASVMMVGMLAAGCHKKAAGPAGPAMQGLPVQTALVELQPVARANEYVATIKSRRSATINPQVSGQLTGIMAKSGDHVRAGQVLMEIDPRQQQATVASLKSTERQKKALADYDATELARQTKLFEAGVVSRQVLDQATQAAENAKADYQAAVETRRTQEQVLAYYTVRAPFAGVVGDVPVHVGDYATPSSTLTTVDENKDLEAYIYIPTERSADVRMGLGVELADNNGKTLESTKIDFVSPQVDPTLQGILVKAPVHATPEILRNAQLVKARVVWDTKPTAVVPVLAVVRQGGAPFVYVMTEQGGHFFASQRSVTLGDTIGNLYAVTAGVNPGDKVIVSGTQFLVNNMPVIPLPSGPPAAGH